MPRNQKMITGTTKILGILGYPLDYTISPAIHNAAIEHLGLDLAYLPFKVDKDHFADFFSSIKHTNIVGVNITMPFKEATALLVDELSVDAKAIGAVNTVVFKNGKAIGDNTDAAGFIQSLQEDAGFTPNGCSAVVLGAGGAAKAVVYSLIKEGASDVLVLSGNSDKSAGLALSFNNAKVRSADLTLQKTSDLAHADLWINATPVGLEEDRYGISEILSSIKDGAVFYDLVYQPLETKLMLKAQSRGARTCNGIGMLVRQAALSFSLWTGVEAPRSVMKAAALRNQAS